MAKSLDGDHFNWIQIFSNPGAVTFRVPRSVQLDFLSIESPTFPSWQFSREDEWSLDPALASQGYIISHLNQDGSYNGYAIGIPSDNQLFYYDEASFDLQRKTYEYWLEFSDYPLAPDGWFDVHPRMRFETRIALVKKNGSYIPSTWVHTWSHANTAPEVRWKNYYLAKSVDPPEGRSRRTRKDTRYDGLKGTDKAIVPPLMGKNVSNGEVKRKYLNNKHFKFRIEYITDHADKGFVIAQKPEPYSGAHIGSEVILRVSSGSSIKN